MESLYALLISHLIRKEILASRSVGCFLKCYPFNSYSMTGSGSAVVRSPGKIWLCLCEWQPKSSWKVLKALTLRVRLGQCCLELHCGTVLFLLPITRLRRKLGQNSSFRTIPWCNRPFARWRHFATTTRTLQGFAFLCKYGLLFCKRCWGYQIQICSKMRTMYKLAWVSGVSGRKGERLIPPPFPI